jgi:hypothetical protein
MASDYSGLTRNLWTGTFSPTASHPIVLDTELRGSLRTVSGSLGDRLTDITGQRLEEGMLVYLKTGYTAGATVRVGGLYYRYNLLSGETRNTNTGEMPNAEGNWTVNQSGLTVSNIDGLNVIANEVDNVTTIRFDSDSGFDVVDLGNGEIKIQMNSTFKTWKVAGESDLVASGLDTVEFVAGPGITINTDPFASPDKQIIFGTPEKSVFMYQDGNLTIKGGTTRWYAPYALIISKIIARLAGPADDLVQIRIRKSGNSVHTINMLAGDLKEESVVSISLAIDDYLTVDVFNIGTNAQPGYGLSVEFKYNFISATGLASSASNLAIEETGTINLSTNSLSVVDSWSISSHRSAKYLVSINQGTNFQTSEILVTHNNTSAFISEYGVIETTGSLATFSASVDGGMVTLKVLMASPAAATIDFSKRYI